MYWDFLYKNNSRAAKSISFSQSNVTPHKISSTRRSEFAVLYWIEVCLMAYLSHMGTMNMEWFATSEIHSFSVSDIESHLKSTLRLFVCSEITHVGCEVHLLFTDKNYPPTSFHQSAVSLQFYIDKKISFQFLWYVKRIERCAGWWQETKG